MSDLQVNENTVIVIKRNKGIIHALRDLVKSNKNSILSDGKLTAKEEDAAMNEIMKIQDRRLANNQTPIFSGGRDKSKAGWRTSFVVHPNQKIEFTPDEIKLIYAALGVTFKDQSTEPPKNQESNPVGDNAPENKPAVTDSIASNKPEATDSIAANKPAVTDSISSNKPVVTDSISSNKPEATDSIAANKPAVTDSIAANKPAVTDSIAANKPAVTDSIAANKPAVTDSIAANKPAVTDSISSNKPVVTDSIASKITVAADSAAVDTVVVDSVVIKKPIKPAVTDSIASNKPVAPDSIASNKPEITPSKGDLIKIKSTPQNAAKASKNDNDAKKRFSLSWGEIGKIGLNSAKNFVKGMFCDENGFSLKRTAMSVGTIAVLAGAAPIAAAFGASLLSLEALQLWQNWPVR